MSPVFFVFPLLTAVLVDKLNNINKKNIYITYLNKFILISSIVPGILFMKIYFQPDIRVTASNWMVQNLPPGSSILSEAGNVVNFPVIDHQFQVVNFDFYNHDSTALATAITNSDYIIIPSRRVFKNYNLNYYQSLFSGNLGFSEIKKFSVFNDENAEETWSVFDHPVIRIYQKVNNLSIEEIQQILNT